MGGWLGARGAPARSLTRAPASRGRAAPRSDADSARRRERRGGGGGEGASRAYGGRLRGSPAQLPGAPGGPGRAPPRLHPRRPSPPPRARGAPGGGCRRPALRVLPGAGPGPPDARLRSGWPLTSGRRNPEEGKKKSTGAEGEKLLFFLSYFLLGLKWRAGDCASAGFREKPGATPARGARRSWAREARRGGRHVGPSGL